MWLGSRNVDQNKHVSQVTGEKAMVGRSVGQSSMAKRSVSGIY